MKPFNIFKKKKYKCDKNHAYFKVLEAMETFRFSQLGDIVGTSKAELIRVFFVYYMVGSFIAWGHNTISYLKKNKKLPAFSKDYLWEIIYEYRNRSIIDWESNWDNNRAMRILVKKVDEIRHKKVDLAYDKVMEIYRKRTLTHDDKLDLILDSLKETFLYTFEGFNEVAIKLNGELEKELKNWDKVK